MLKKAAVPLVVLSILVGSSVLWSFLAPVPGVGADQVAVVDPLPTPWLLGDTCGEATYEEQTLPWSVTWDTSDLTDDYNLGTAGACAGGGTQYPATGLGPDSVFLIATDQTCDLEVSMSPTDTVDLALYVLSPDCGDVAGNCVRVDDAGGVGATEEVTFTATAGQDYFVIVDGYNDQHGRYDLTISELTATGCQLIEVGEHSLGGWV